jgi:HIV Tat-specific factor 1
MYENEQGNFKGDALVVYFRPESVNLAVQMLDDSHFRLGVEGPGGKMRVQAADFSYKSQQDPPVNSSKKDQKKIIKKTQKLNRFVRNRRSGAGLTIHSKLADWDDDEPSTVPGTSSRWGRVVILKHMFTLQELEVCTMGNQ